MNDIKELIKILSIKEINYMIIDYTDEPGNFKVLKLDHRKERADE